MMHIRKSSKFFIYFFLLILVGSINNIGFSNLDLKSIKQINVSGLDDKDNENLSKEMKNLKLNNIFFINSDQIYELINSNSLVEKFEIFKKYPSSIDIKIQKTNFLAKINKNGKIYLVGSNAKISKYDLNYHDLPFIFGKPDIIDFLNFKKKIDQSNFSYEEIKNLYFYPSKRWDLELKNNIFVKLPKDNVKESLNLSYKFLNEKNLQDINLIDTRFKNQVVIK